MEPPYPGSCGLEIIARTRSLLDLKAAIAETRSYSVLAPLVVVILHHFDFSESGAATERLALDDLEPLLRRLRSHAGIEVTTLSAVVRPRKKDLVWTARYRRLKRRFPNWLEARISGLCLLARPVWKVAYHWASTFGKRASTA